MWECEYCGGEVESMGVLGRLHWGRCRQCGLESKTILSSLSEYTDEEQQAIDHILDME